MRKRGILLAVGAGICAFMIAEVALSVLLAMVQEIAEAYGKDVTILVRWAAFFLLFVCIRIGITVKRRAAKRVQQQPWGAKPHQP
jgi:cell division protein FtsX